MPRSKRELSRLPRSLREDCACSAGCLGAWPSGGSYVTKVSDVPDPAFPGGIRQSISRANMFAETIIS